MITSTHIAFGDQLGAQLTTLAELYFIAKHNRQELVFFDELYHFRRGYQFYAAFDLGIPLLRNGRPHSRSESPRCWRPRNKYVRKAYESIKVRTVARRYGFHAITDCASGVHADRRLLELDATKNYDILSGLGTYQDWKACEDEFLARCKFREGPYDLAAAQIEKVRRANPGKELVSVHARRTDYLTRASLNLGPGYYHRALESFADDKYLFYVFSDDIESCRRERFLDGRATFFSESQGLPPAVDLCLMSMCDHAIIANSTFSFWGAMLNRDPGKKVVCPAKFIGDGDLHHQYINGSYYPASWTALEGDFNVGRSR